MKPALIVVDIQNDFIQGTIGSRNAIETLPHVREALLYAKKNKWPRIITCDEHHDKDFDFNFRPIHAIENTWGAKIALEDDYIKGAHIIKKRKYSPFFLTGLDDLLRKLKVKKLVICGLHIDVCLNHTFADAFFRDYETFLLLPASAATSPELEIFFLDYFQRYYGTIILQKMASLKKILA